MDQENNGKRDEPRVPYRRERTPSIVVQSLGLSFQQQQQLHSAASFDTADLSLAHDDNEREDDDEVNRFGLQDRDKKQQDQIASKQQKNQDQQQQLLLHQQSTNNNSNKNASTGSLSSSSSSSSPSRITATSSFVSAADGATRRIAGSVTPPPAAINRKSFVPAAGARRQSLAVDGIGAFAASPATGNATGSLRNKVALKPGHSLMGWIRLVDTAKDLSGTGGKLLDVTPEELAKHNTVNDCWVALKGNVYNVTLYLSYHPGGVDELMRAAGQDATDLFNEIHRWVNYESILAKCLVGRYRYDPCVSPESTGAIRRASAAVVPRRKSLALPVRSPTKFHQLSLTPQNSLGASTLIQTTPTYVITQDKSFVRLEIQATNLALVRHRNLICDLMDDRPTARSAATNSTGQKLHISVILSADWLYRVHIRLHHSVEKNSVKAQLSSDKGSYITLTMTKSEPVIWCAPSDDSLVETRDPLASAICAPLSLDDSLCEMTLADKFFRPCRLSSKHQLTHNTYLFEFQIPGLMYVPIAWHVLLRDHRPEAINDVLADDSAENESAYRIHKSYTPVLDTLLNSNRDGLTDKTGFMGKLYFIIKIYPDGELTPKFGRLRVGDYVDISDYQWVDIDIEQVAARRSAWVLVAAGTGITPMIRTIAYLLSRPVDEIHHVTLLFFNRTQADIIWRPQFDQLRDQHSNRFRCEHILSNEPTSSKWAGARGHISKDLLANHTDRYNSDDLQVLACGPRPFTQLVKSLVDELDLNENLHVFHG